MSFRTESGPTAAVWFEVECWRFRFIWWRRVWWGWPKLVYLGDYQCRAFAFGRWWFEVSGGNAG